jgi:cation:H+ antiporter
MLTITFLIFVAGIGLLYFGAEWLVKGASQLALGIGIRPLIVGLTILAIGTSAPEFAVSLLSAIHKSKDIALGNIIGSNIANIALVIGVAAVIRPMRIQVNTVRLEMPYLIVATLVFHLLSLDGLIGFFDGLGMLCGFMLFMVYLGFMASRDRRDDKKLHAEMGDYRPDKRSIPFHLILILGGLTGLLLGSYLLVSSAVELAQALGVSQLVIGITLVAVGTSLPELAISAVGSYRGHTDLAVGNAVGSNIFNILFVIAFVSMIYPIPVDPELLGFQYLFMSVLTMIFLPMMWTGFILNRLEGVLLLFIYAFFNYLIFK